MRMNKNKATAKPIIYAAVLMAFFSCLLSACSNKDNADSSRSETTSQTEYISQDKESVGYYKRVGISKKGETFEEMKESLDTMKKGYLVLKEDGTAFFDLDGEITEYIFDKQNLYFADDTEKSNGFSYTYIGGRLIVNDGTTVTQYLRLTDEELEAYLNN
jgi:hypothetical protein